MIGTVNLSAGYGGRGVVKEVNLLVGAGEFVAVIGPNASGKTTFLKTLASLLKPVDGVVYVNGVEAAKMRARDIARLVGVVLTEQPRTAQLTVFEIVALGRYPYTNPFGTMAERDRCEILKALEDVGIAHLASCSFNELSDGQRQKVMIARALTQEPKILILDEPVTYLDPRARVEVLLTIRRIARERGIAVMASLHEVELALRMADRLLVVSEGKVTAYDSPEDFVALNGPIQLYGLSGEYTFSPELMSVEFKPCYGNLLRVFVIAGGGSGALVYRTLARLGYSFSTGVLHEGDIDYHVARMLGGTVIAEKAFQPISHANLRRAAEEARKCSVAVYTSPPIGLLNKENQHLAETIASEGIPLIVFGPTKVDGAVERVDSLGQLSEKISESLAARPVSPVDPKVMTKPSIIVHKHKPNPLLKLLTIFIHDLSLFLRVERL